MAETEGEGWEERQAVSGDAHGDDADYEMGREEGDDEDEDDASFDDGSTKKVSVKKQLTKKKLPKSTSLAASTPPKPAVLRPALRGFLKRTSEAKVVYEGQWGMDDNAFNGGVLSEFLYRRERVHEDQSQNNVHDSDIDSSGLAQDAHFSGYFFMLLHGRKRKIVEKNVLFEFRKDESLPPGTVRVNGSGTNQFGTYLLDGTFTPNTGELNLYREYKVVPGARAQKSRAAARKSSNSSGDILPEKASRVRRMPSHLAEEFDDDMPEKLSRMKTVVRSTMRNDREGWFLQPVDADRLGLVNYHEVIKQPMDLGTVLRKLEEGKYTTPDEAADDVRITFNNAITFNPPGNAVHLSAKRLLASFEGQMRKFAQQSAAAFANGDGAYVAGNERPKKRKSTGNRNDSGQFKRSRSDYNMSGRRTMSDLFSSDSEDLDDNEDGSEDGVFVPSSSKRKRKAGGSRSSRTAAVSSDVQVLREQVEHMNRQIKMMEAMHRESLERMMSSQGLNAAAQPISAPPALTTPTPDSKQERISSSSGSSDVRPLSYQEMRQLGQDIDNLPAEMIQGVITIITQSGATLGGDGDELELEIEALDPPALKKLQKYVKRCLSKTRENIQN